MEEHNILSIANRSEFRAWLEAHHASEKECWVCVKRGRPVDDRHFWYLDAVEEALCFRWIDSTLKRLSDGRLAQRLSPRRPKSHWTQLNMDRCMNLEDRGLMTEAGRQAFEKAFEYKIIPPDSELSQRVKEEAKLRRPGMYKES
ncbi:MAG: hypothetical protein IIV53_04680 [Bacteroidaceae bacterium]|nr:hypothetical protein [Bacteroidaceae bacterium]